MPKIDDLFKTSTTLGVAVGIGATILAVALVPAIPAIVRAARPTARAAVKSGLVLIERGREIMAEANEEFEDMLAEVRAELQQERSVKGADIDGDDAFEDVLAEVKSELQKEAADIDEDVIAPARNKQS